MPSDEETIASVLEGNVGHYECLVLRHQQRLYRFLVGMLGNTEDAEDVAQETFVKAYKSLATFERRSLFYTWLQRIGRNLAISHRRKYSRESGGRKQVLETVADNLTSREQSSEDMVYQRETDALVRAAIHQLPHERRDILILRDLDEMDYSQIAETLEIPIGTVRSRLHRARTELKEILENSMGSIPL